jgi:hypothetical protein
MNGGTEIGVKIKNGLEGLSAIGGVPAGPTNRRRRRSMCKF